MSRPASLTLIAALVLAVAGCAIVGGTLGGREKCWDPSEPLLASLMKGNLELDPARLNFLVTPEGDRLSITFPTMAVRTDSTGSVAVVDRNGVTVAVDGELVTLFGGLNNGYVIVCSIEERHPGE